jgi:hypothetical protein
MCVLLVALFPLTSYARSAALSDALDEIADALDAARDEGGSCEKALADGLKDVRDDLRDDPGAKQLKRALRDLEDLEKDADRDCPGRISKMLARAARSVEDELGEDDDKGRDRADGRDEPAKVSVTELVSRVDLDCLAQSQANYAYAADEQKVVEWLARCRDGSFQESQFATMTTENDNACITAAEGAYGYALGTDAQNAFADNCKLFRCKMEGLGAKSMSSTVDTSCVQQRSASYSYAADAATVNGWLNTCRSAVSGTNCFPTSYPFNADCFAKALSVMGYQVTEENVASQYLQRQTERGVRSAAQRREARRAAQAARDRT